MAEPSTLQHIFRRKTHVRGFTYLSLIIVVAIIGMVTASAIKLGSVLQRSRAEQELLEIGAAFSDALKSYADATPQGQPSQPPSLKELLKDPRFPVIRRHLRKIFVDPMTGKAEWGIVYLGDKVGVLAVYSLSSAKPVKVGGFAARYSGFESKNRISDWKFTQEAGVPAGGVSIKTQSESEKIVPIRQQNNIATQEISSGFNSSVPVTSEISSIVPLLPANEPASHSEQPAVAESEQPPP